VLLRYEPLVEERYAVLVAVRRDEDAALELDL
jgi:hypothetical protein